MVIKCYYGSGCSWFNYFFSKNFLTADNVWVLNTYYRNGKAIGAFIYLLLKKGSIPLTKEYISRIGTNGILVGLASVTGYLAIAAAPLSFYMVLIKPVSVVLITLAGLCIFKENKDLSNKELLGFILAGLVMMLMIYTSLVS